MESLNKQKLLQPDSVSNNCKNQTRKNISIDIGSRIEQQSLKDPKDNTQKGKPEIFSND
jgi:hypothetical protein